MEEHDGAELSLDPIGLSYDMDFELVPQIELSLDSTRARPLQRKDPICDACKERKTKCDVTRTAGCSSCERRGVKCQFTFESNRRFTTLYEVSRPERQLKLSMEEEKRLGSVVSEAHAMTINRGPQDGTVAIIPSPTKANEPERMRSGLTAE